NAHWRESGPRSRAATRGWRSNRRGRWTTYGAIRGTDCSRRRGARARPVRPPPLTRRYRMAVHKIGIRVDEKQQSPSYGSVTYDWACLRPKRDVDPLPAKLHWFSKQGQFTIRFANG